jgi:hypothetical protein
MNINKRKLKFLCMKKKVVIDEINLFKLSIHY